jgi:hypothetical protein
MRKKKPHVSRGDMGLVRPKGGGRVPQAAENTLAG